MTSDELIERLSIDATRLARWIEAGLPHKQIDGETIFNPDHVAAWLIETGRATREDNATGDSAGQTIVRTIPEVANYFGVSQNAVAKWLKDPQFPGKAGERGRQNGRFPLEAIQAWRDARDGNRIDEETGSTAREREWLADAEMRELELAKMRGELIEVEVAAAELELAIHNAKAVLGDLIEELVDEMPADAPADWPAFKRQQRKLLEKRIRQALTRLAEMAMPDGSQEEQVDQEEPQE